MKAMRVAAAGLVGGIVMFIWGAMAHTALPIGMMGTASLPPEVEGAVMPLLTENVLENAFYRLPGYDQTTATEAETAAFMAKMEMGPSGVLILKSGPGAVLGPKTLVPEFVSNFLAALVAAMVMASICGGRMCRAMAAAAFGLIGTLSISVSYSIWDAFPMNFTIGQGLEQVIGWGLSGLAMAFVLPKGCGCGSACKCAGGAAAVV